MTTQMQHIHIVGVDGGVAGLAIGIPVCQRTDHIHAEEGFGIISADDQTGNTFAISSNAFANVIICIFIVGLPVTQSRLIFRVLLYWRV